jgi:hypothetical protein
LDAESSSNLQVREMLRGVTWKAWKTPLLSTASSVPDESSSQWCAVLGAA